jgi:ribosomal protein RSM22 (predicted rRNA methylase)
VQLPVQVRRVIEERAESVNFAALRRSAAAMSDAYRNGVPQRGGSIESTVAYLITRMPATYAAAYSVLREVRTRIGEIGSILDVGAGTGAASLAARECFPGAALTLIERDPAMTDAARLWLPDARMIAADATQMPALPPHDLVIASYALGEFSTSLGNSLWQAVRVALIVIEPGTPRGFSSIRKLRDELLSAGAHMVAPCPFESACPIVDPDWCHFASRVERSSLHRRLKQGGLGYEDEKFSYVALARAPVEVARARVVRRPTHHPGLIVLETCTPAGLRTERVSRRDPEAFRAARKALWGAPI